MMLAHDLAVSQFILDTYAAAKNGLPVSFFLRWEADHYYLTDGSAMLKIGAKDKRALNVIHNVLFPKQEGLKEFGIARGERLAPPEGMAAIWKLFTEQARAGFKRAELTPWVYRGHFDVRLLSTEDGPWFIQEKYVPLLVGYEVGVVPEENCVAAVSSGRPEEAHVFVMRVIGSVPPMPEVVSPRVSEAEPKG